jgi:hypothetical protein
MGWHEKHDLDSCSLHLLFSRLDFFVLVTLGSTCADFCWMFLRQIPLQSFVSAVSSSVRSPNLPAVAQRGGMQPEELYSLNGKRVYRDLHARAIARQLLISKNKLGETRIIMPAGN